MFMSISVFFIRTSRATHWHFSWLDVGFLAQSIKAIQRANTVSFLWKSLVVAEFFWHMPIVHDIVMKSVRFFLFNFFFFIKIQWYKSFSASIRYQTYTHNFHSSKIVLKRELFYNLCKSVLEDSYLDLIN